VPGGADAADPDLLAGLAPASIAANGMDAPI
jgi:hypothetical protein